MVDVFALLVSLGMLGLVTLMAIRLDRTREWFERPRNLNPPPKRAAWTKEPGPALAARGARPPAPARRPSRFPGAR